MPPRLRRLSTWPVFAWPEPADRGNILWEVHDLQNPLLPADSTTMCLLPFSSGPTT
jgi:hypothetical protein